VHGGDPLRLSSRQSHWAAESLDGRYLYHAAGAKVWKVPVGGGAETEVAECGNTFNLAITQNGFYFETAERGSAEIHFFHFETGKSKLAVTPGKRGGRGLAISPDGRWLLYSQVERSGSDLMLVENFR
jgi:hypothetical protein